MPDVIQAAAVTEGPALVESAIVGGNEGSSPSIGPTPGRVIVPADEFIDLLEQSMDASQNMMELMEGHELTKEELEFEKALCAAFRREATTRLHPEGIRIQSWIPDGLGLGYVIVARDRQQRRYDVTFQYGQVLEGDVLYRPDPLNRGPAEFGRVVIDMVVEDILKAREKYHARMNG